MVSPSIYSMGSFDSTTKKRIKEAAALLIKGLYIFLGAFFLLTIIAVSGCDSRSDSTKPDEMIMYSALGAKVSSLDPGNIGDTTAAGVATQIFECLYDYHYLKRPYELIPKLAEAMPIISDDSLTYEISIKDGIYFTDDVCFENGNGRELTVDDLIFAWKRIADIKYLSKNWWVFDNRIVGLDEFREYTKTCKTREEVDYSRDIEGLKAIGDYTLVIKLKKPWPQILFMLAHLPTAPIAKEAVNYYGKNIINHPIGTGPFILKKWNKGSYIEMQKNPKFREEFYPSDGQQADIEAGLLADAGQPIPFADRIFFMIMEEDPPAWFSFLQGKLDVSTIPKDNFEQAIVAGHDLSPQFAEKGIHLKIFQTPTTYWLGFNMEDPVVGNNKPLRQAISCAIDRETYIDLFTNNRAEEAFGFLPPLMKSYDETIKGQGGNYNLEKAKKLIMQAEQIHGSEIPVLTLALPGTDIVYRQFGQFYKKTFKEIGLKLEIDYMDWPTYLQKLHRKDLQLFQSGWIADYPDAENFLQLFYSKNVSPGTNSFNYVNKKFDKIYEKVSVMPDCPERTKLYRKAQQIVVDDCVAAFLTHGVSYVLHHDWVYNYKPNAFQYGLSKFRRIDAAKRKAYQLKYRRN